MLNLHKIKASKEHLLKQKFLNFFTLVCVIKKNDDSNSFWRWKRMKKVFYL